MLKENNFSVVHILGHSYSGSGSNFILTHTKKKKNIENICWLVGWSRSSVVLSASAHEARRKLWKPLAVLEGSRGFQRVPEGSRGS